MTVTDILVQVLAGVGGIALGALLLFPDVVRSMFRRGRE